MKNILLLVHDDAGQEARLQTALDLTRALDGHLTCIGVTPSPVVAGELYAGFGEAVLLTVDPETEARNKAALTQRLSHEDVRWNWLDAMGDIAGCILNAALLSDLIVLNRALAGHSLPDMRTIASKILMHTRCPVVAVPEGLKQFKANGRALIAWDGQASVAATLRACVPLLKLASDVHVFMSREGTDKVGPGAAAEYLSRHGIRASVKVTRDGLHAADVLIGQEAKLWPADYVMMGAYSHGRMSEVFGGVTKRMLSKSELPLVLGH